MNIALFRATVLCTAAIGLFAIRPAAAEEASLFTAALQDGWRPTPAYAVHNAEPGHLLECGEHWLSLGPSPRITAIVEAQMLQLDYGTAKALPVVVNADTGAMVLSTQDAGYDMQPGLRGQVDMMLDSGVTIQGVYFGLEKFQNWAFANTDDTGGHPISLPPDRGTAGTNGTGFNSIDAMTITQQAEFYNAELNLLMPLGVTDFSVLGGFRMFNFDEFYNIAAFDAGTDTTSNYSINTHNRLYGGQIGGRYKHDWGRLGMDFIGKAGVYWNQGYQDTLLIDAGDATLDRDFHVSRSARVAFIGELGLSGTYQLATHLWARAGYSVNYVEGIARAANQLDFSDTATSGSGLSFNHGAMIHGVNLGVEARW